MDLTALLLSRLQFAFPVSFHIIFPSFTIGLAAWLTVLEALHLATSRPSYRLVFDDEHYGVVHYGTDPEDLNQTAKSPIRLNRAHRETIFRVRMDRLQPKTIYYYEVTSIGADGQSDGVESPVNHFTTPAPGERIIAYPQPK